MYASVDAVRVLIEKGANLEASYNGHVEAMRVLIEKGALIEAAEEVRIHSHATTHARSQTLMHAG